MRLMPAKYAAALFDLDNTLWDRSAAILATGRLLHQTDPAVRATASAEGAAAKFAAFDDNGHAGRDRLIGRVLAQWPGITRNHEEMVAWYLEAVRSALPRDPTALALLHELNAAGMPWGIVTNGTPMQHATIRAQGLEGLTRCVVVSEEAGCHKPEPAIFHLALNQLGLLPSRDVLFVGDDAVADIGGAQSVGLSTAWVSRGQSWPSALESPNHQVNHVTELGPLLLG